nr:hypothetical protein [Tanacetum cinerariifolium]
MILQNQYPLPEHTLLLQVVLCSNPSTNIQSTSAPSTPTNVHAEENIDNQAEKGEHLQDDEFTNLFCAPAQEEAESSPHNNGNSNVPTFNQPKVSEYQRTKDHPLEQVRGNPSRLVQTRRQLATDPKMYADVPSQQELDLLFGHLYDEFFNAGSNPSTNIQSTSAPSTPTNVHAEENIDNQ